LAACSSFVGFWDSNTKFLLSPHPPRQRLPSCLLIENALDRQYKFDTAFPAEAFPIKASDDTLGSEQSEVNARQPTPAKIAPQRR
jgi:hypothetical protein